MAPTTRSTKGRSSAGSKASSPQVQAGPSRGVSQQGPSQRVAGAPVSSGTLAVESDEDEDDDDEDEDEDDEEDESEDDDEESEDESDDDNGNDDNNHQQEAGNTGPNPRMDLLKLFASTEPNGLTTVEIMRGQGNEVSRKYRQLLSVVTTEALQNEGFYDALMGVLRIPSDEWGRLVCDRMRSRFDLVTRRSSPNTVVDTANHMLGLMSGFQTMTDPDTWLAFQYGTRIAYFTLLLRVLQHIAASDFTAQRAGSGSGGSSPYTGDPSANHNLYQIVADREAWANAASSLDYMFRRLNGPLYREQAADLKKLLDNVRNSTRRGTLEPDGSETPSLKFKETLKRMCEAMSPAASTSGSSRRH